MLCASLMTGLYFLLIHKMILDKIVGRATKIAKIMKTLIFGLMVCMIFAKILNRHIFLNFVYTLAKSRITFHFNSSTDFLALLNFDRGRIFIEAQAAFIAKVLLTVGSLFITERVELSTMLTLRFLGTNELALI